MVRRWVSIEGSFTARELSKSNLQFQMEGSSG
jgi:hypothetical protein